MWLKHSYQTRFSCFTMCSFGTTESEGKKWETNTVTKITAKKKTTLVQKSVSGNPFLADTSPISLTFLADMKTNFGSLCDAMSRLANTTSDYYGRCHYAGVRKLRNPPFPLASANLAKAVKIWKRSSRESGWRSAGRNQRTHSRHSRQFVSRYTASAHFHSSYDIYVRISTQFF